MKIKQTNKSSRKVIVILISGAILLTSGIYAAYIYKLGPFAHLQQSAIEEVANKSDATNPQQKKDLPSSDQLKSTGGDKTTDEIPVAEAGSIDITTLEQRDGSVIFSASLANVSTPGTCSALFENADGAARPVTRTAASSSNSCAETIIPQDEFVALGTWKLTLRYYANNTQLVATKTIEVK